jgi:hypothetical protein
VYARGFVLPSTHVHYDKCNKTQDGCLQLCVYPVPFVTVDTQFHCLAVGSRTAQVKSGLWHFCGKKSGLELFRDLILVSRNSGARGSVVG